MLKVPNDFNIKKIFSASDIKECWKCWRRRCVQALNLKRYMPLQNYFYNRPSFEFRPVEHYILLFRVEAKLITNNRIPPNLEKMLRQWWLV